MMSDNLGLLEGILETYLLRGHAPKFNGKLHRASLAKALGISESKLSRMSSLQERMSRFEYDYLANLDDSRDAAVRERDYEKDGYCEATDSKILSFRKTVQTGRIIASIVKFDGIEYRIPTLVWPSGIDAIASDWLRNIAIKRNRPFSTVEEYAKVYRKFVNFRDRNNHRWDDVNDDTLRAWLAEMKLDGLGARRINSSINTVYDFYRWAEETGRLKDHVEIVERQFLPDHLKSFKFPISSRRVQQRRNGLITTTWRTSVFTTGVTSSHNKRHTPTADQIDSIFDIAIDDLRHGARNSLLLSWALDTGGRNHEILQLRLSDLPQTDDELRRMHEMDFWPISVKRKGGKEKRGVLRPSSDLIRRTIVYIKTERAELAAQICGRQRGDCKYVFLSEKGRVLSTDSVTRIVGKIFRAAGVENANIHRLRAKFAQNMVEAALDALQDAGIAVGGTSNWHETALTMAQEMMGHSSIESLRPYLQVLLKRRVDLSPTYQKNKENGAQRERRLLGVQETRLLKSDTELSRIASLIRQGEKKAAAELLRSLASAFESLDD